MLMQFLAKLSFAIALILFIQWGVNQIEAYSVAPDNAILEALK
jgi:flagellar biogenesis protein FliO